jgi:hypothetical protein
MIKFSDQDRISVLEAAQLARLIRRAYRDERLANDRTGLNPEVRTALGPHGELLKLEWHADQGGGDAGYIGQTFATLRFQGKKMDAPRFLSESKIVLRKQFLATWPDLALQLGSIGVNVQRLMDLVAREEAKILAAFPAERTL